MSWNREDNFVEGGGWDNFFRLKFKYLLPIGAGRDQVIATHKIKDGFIESDTDINNNGLDFSPFWDNRDFSANPSKGFSIRENVH